MSTVAIKAQSCGVSHVRVKRGSETFFVIVDIAGGATAGELRAKTAHMMGVDLTRLRLCVLGGDDDGNGKTRYFLDDEKLLDLKVATDDVLCAVLQETADTWETPHFIQPPPIEPDLPAKGVKARP